ncbi:MAG: arginine deiminase family protein, partial [Gemmatimonadota bacterium]
VAEQWQALGYLDEPDFDRACDEYDAFAAVFEESGVAVEWMPSTDSGLDSIYVRDASIVADRGLIGASMGKGARSEEPGLQLRQAGALNLDVAGVVERPGSLEGGDCTWLASDVLAVGRGYRTNLAGIDQLDAMLPDVDVLRVPLPHWKGPGDVFHLMSVVSPLADRVALVYLPLLAVSFVEWLRERDFTLIEVPDDEFDSQGCNVLALGPTRVLALDGNVETRRRIESAGIEVTTFEGREISAKGCGGPTCLTRPLGWRP